MDYPADPAVRLHNGKFTDGDPSQGIAASIDPAEHNNAITDELLAIIRDGGLTPVESDHNQVLAALKRIFGPATLTKAGLVKRASDALAAQGTNTDQYVTPAHLPKPATTERAGLVERATDSEAGAGEDTERYITAKHLRQAIDQALKSRELPVGSVYANARDSRNPSTLLGYGKWSALGSGEVLLGVSASHPLGERGGSERVKLSPDQMPTHYHFMFKDGSDNDVLSQSTYTVAAEGDDVTNEDDHYRMRGYAGDGADIGRTSAAGGDQSHENMMPYRAVYRWQRVE